MPFCGNCGAKYEAGKKFCGECGHKLPVPAAAPAPKAAPTETKSNTVVVPTHVSEGSAGNGSLQNKMFNAVTGKGGDPTAVSLGLDAQVIVKAGTQTSKCKVEITEGLERLIKTPKYNLKLGTSVTKASQKLWAMHLTVPDDKVTIRSIYRVMCDMDVSEKFIKYESNLKGKVGSYEYKGYQVMYYIPQCENSLAKILSDGFEYDGIQKLVFYKCPMQAINAAGPKSLNKIVACKVVLYAPDYQEINGKCIFKKDDGLLPETVISYELPTPDQVN